ncbi:MAG: polysaccharide biosynthesis C-terminal domain-containing protein [Bacteroidota bacterium]|nr:polysaccharide biosynthesis C-terminal domain-containing protein [Bacteroidota bacterium]
MFAQIKRLGADTAIYGISTIVGRFLTFLLVPFYTNVLVPGEYGIVSYVYSLIAFVNVIYSYGIESAYFKYSSTLEIGTVKQNFTTPFLSVAGTSAVFSLFIIVAAHPILRLINVAQDYGSIVYYTAGILAFDAIAIIPFASLRMERKAKRFAALKLLNIVINVLLNIYFLVFLKMGITGIFISGFAASAGTFLFLVPTVVRHFSLPANGTLYKALLKYGVPYIPAGLATMAIQVIDRPILRAFTNDATVGIYQANYRLGIFMMLIVSMYDYAWRPFYFSIVREPHAKEIFSRVLTYLVLFMSAVFLALTFFVGDIVKLSVFGKHLIHPDYWSGLNIVPIVLLGYFFLGISTNLTAGIYIEKRTKLLSVNTFVGAAVNIIANYFFIPLYGMTGAAWATFLAYFAMALVVYAIVQKIYPIKYELWRLSKIAISAGGITAFYFLLSPHWLHIHTRVFIELMKVALVLLFFVLLYAMRFFNWEERGKLRGVFKKMFSPSI